MPYINSEVYDLHDEDEDVRVIHNSREPDNSLWYYNLKDNGCMVVIPSWAQRWGDCQRVDFSLVPVSLIKTYLEYPGHRDFIFEDREMVEQYFDSLKVKYNLMDLSQRSQLRWIAHYSRQQKQWAKNHQANLFKERRFNLALWALKEIFNTKAFGSELNFFCKSKVLSYLFYFCDEQDCDDCFKKPSYEKLSN